MNSASKPKRPVHLRADSIPAGQDVDLYFNGELRRDVVEAHTKEGWVRLIPRAGEVEGVVLYGDVRFVWPEDR